MLRSSKSQTLHSTLKFMQHLDLLYHVQRRSATESFFIRKISDSTSGNFMMGKKFGKINALKKILVLKKYANFHQLKKMITIYFYNLIVIWVCIYHKKLLNISTVILIRINIRVLYLRNAGIFFPARNDFVIAICY